MTTKQLQSAVKLAREYCAPLDDTILHGICLESFQAPKYASIEVIAYFISHHCKQFNGGWDDSGFNDIAPALKRKVQIV